MASVFLCFLSLSSLLISASSSTSPSISLSLSPISIPDSSSTPWEYLSNFAKLTLERAHHLKNPKKNASYSVFHGTTKTPLYPRSYGGYTVSLSFGTPPQKIPLVFDTGSSLLWVPCTSRYVCTNCTFSGVDPTKITTFMPKLSSTTKIIGCRNPKCGWLYGRNVSDRCPDCDPEALANCSSSCPSYIIQYGLGATSGVPISDNLDFPAEVVPDFFFGCSILSLRQPEGIAGFGRAPTSLPNQLKLGKFSYCLLSHKFDDAPKSSDLVLTGADAGNGTAGVKYTPFLKNPIGSPYDEYYYVSLRKITVAKKKVKLPYGFLVPGPNGNGGTIVDSGSTLTFMDRALFDPVVKELVAQMGRYKRARDVEARSAFGLCFNVSSDHQEKVSFPELVFYFKGGAKMELPLNNYFSFISNLGVLCLTIVSNASPARPSGPVGPAMILGNYQQQNFFIEYDLKHQRLGFKKQACG